MCQRHIGKKSKHAPLEQLDQEQAQIWILFFSLYSFIYM